MLHTLRKKKARGHLIVPRGSSIGRYTILETVGAGATGTVHAAYDPELDRKVALKVIRRSHRRSRREAHALARLAHPNVITIYDVGSHDDMLFIAMVLIAGRTLSAYLAER